LVINSFFFKSRREANLRIRWLSKRIGLQQEVIRTMQPTFNDVYGELATVKKELEKVQGELKAEGEHGLCVICFAEPITVAIQPCGHQAFCKKCASDARVKLCPICNGKKNGIQRIYSAATK